LNQVWSFLARLEIVVWSGARPSTPSSEKRDRRKPVLATVRVRRRVGQFLAKNKSCSFSRFGQRCDRGWQPRRVYSATVASHDPELRTYLPQSTLLVEHTSVQTASQESHPAFAT